MVAGVEAPLRRGASKREVSIIGLDLAKNVFQAHGASAEESVVFRRKLSRAQLLKFMAAQPPGVVAMEACANSHHWGRAIGDLGHEVRLIPPAYVKPFVKRQKNDLADDEAIALADANGSKALALDELVIRILAKQSPVARDLRILV